MAEAWSAAFYKSEEWRAFRRYLIQLRGTVCPICHRDFMADTSKLVGHHKEELTPETVHDASVALNPDNVDIICIYCHNSEHKRFGKGVHHVYIVYGAPCSGKSTLVRQLMHRGDIVVDMDLLFRAISGCSLYDKPDQLKSDVFAMRSLLLDRIRRRAGKWGDAYVVGGYPFKLEREELAAKLGAELIFCDETIDRCKANAAADLGIHAKEWGGYIDRWFDDFER